MKKLIIITMMALSLTIMPFAVYSQSEQAASNSPPPVSQPLVREGDLAVKLVDALKIGPAKNEAEAETMLGSSGITPKNGWIADYPVTPDIIGELQSAIANAADTKRLPMGRDEALKAFGKLSADLGLPVRAETGKYAESQPPTSYEYTSPAVVNNYYYEEGPPVVTYYPPPWDYWYLYSWVPCPFFFGGFFFSGFFALHDFHRVVIFANRVVVVSNHVISPINGSVVVIDPPARATGKTLTSTSVTGKTSTSTSAMQKTSAGFKSLETKKAATSIFNRSFERANRTMTSSLGNTGKQNGMNFQQGQGRSFNTPNTTQGRSFSTAPSTGGGSFNHPSRSFGASPNFSEGSRSFSNSHSFGGSSPDHSFGGFSGGHSSGGFSGGHSFSGGFSGGGGGFHGGGGGHR